MVLLISLIPHMLRKRDSSSKDSARKKTFSTSPVRARRETLLRGIRGVHRFFEAGDLPLKGVRV